MRITKENAMPGVTQLSLCDEALTFHHDGQLVGFCLDDPDEPDGDDFQTRLAVKLGDKWWIDVVQDLAPDAEDEEGNGDFAHLLDSEADEDGAEVVATTYDLYGDYCRMAPFTRVEAVANLRKVIWYMLDITTYDWNPSDDFVVECMKRSETMSPEDLYAWVRSHYEAIFQECDDHMHLALMREYDACIDNRCDLDELVLGEEMLRTERRIARCDDRRSSRSGPRARLADRRRWHGDTNRPGTQRQRLRFNSSASHCEKYGRQDERHQLPRREAKAEHAWAIFERTDETTPSVAQEEQSVMAPVYVPSYWTPYRWEAEQFLDDRGLLDSDKRPDTVREEDDAADVEVDEDYIFADYNGPDNPGSDDNVERYFEFLPGLVVPDVPDAEDLQVGHGARILVRRGTPRRELRAM